MKTLSLLLLMLAGATTLYAQADEAEREAYLRKRAAEKAVAEQTVRELGVVDQATLSPDDAIRLAYAYNEIGDNRLALEAVCRVADQVLADKKQLELKAICFHNVNSGENKPDQLRELAFIDRCLDRKYDNHGVWLWRKAKLICQASVAPATLTHGDDLGSEARIIDREQFEYSFELLERAFAAEPKLLDRSELGPDSLWTQAFPLLHDEPRFKALLRRKAEGGEPVDF